MNQDCFVLQCYLLLKVNTAKEIFNVKLLCLLSSYSLLFPHLDNVRTHFVRQRLCGSTLQLLKKISKRRPRADKTKIVLIMKFACKRRFEPINIQILEKKSTLQTVNFNVSLIQSWYSNSGRWTPYQFFLPADYLRPQHWKL